ncbi:hypothetical protein SteCoe_34016 [Stentor coeruleus]|uniref:Uncharacterized protein n=1 Tax=Stentor coeruleus TaxID=5963 RepID=A0A1R2AVH4_9CILI|nr:hypothetical protein SteCoe_34016 [Stentor coeruleus]
MSTYSGILTPLKTTNSDDYSDYYNYLSSVEKHVDSIISSDQAKKIQSRKKFLEDSPQLIKKPSAKSQILEIQEQTVKKIQELLNSLRITQENLEQKFRESKNKRFSIESSSTPVNILEKNQELKEREIREKIRLIHDNEKKKIIKIYEDKKNKIIDEKRESLQKFWRTKMFELNGKLQQAEWKKNSRKKEEEDGKKTLYKKAYEETLEKEKKLLEDEIDEYFNTQFQEKLKIIKEERRGKDNEKEKNDIKSKIENKYQKCYEDEKMAWKNCQDDLILKCVKVVEDEEGEVLSEKEKEIKSQAESEIQELLEEIKKELEKDYAIIVESMQKKVRDKSQYSKDIWIEEAKVEFFKNQHIEAVYDYKQSIKEQVSKDIRKEIEGKIKNEVFKNEQEKVFKKVSEELNFEYELYKKETENFLKLKLNENENNFRGSITEKAKTEVDKKLSQKEKELYIRYIHKLEKMKNDIKKEFEDQNSQELKKKKEALLKEKTLLAQTKAKDNIQINKYDEEILHNLLRLEEETQKLDLKAKEIHQKSRLYEEMTTKPDELPVKSPTKNFTPGYKMFKPEQAKEFPTQILPPSFSAKEIRTKVKPSYKTGKNCVEPSPSNGNNNRESLHKGLLKESCNAKSFSYDSLKLKNKEKSKNSKIKQNAYHELLRQKYGFIQPRLK